MKCADTMQAEVEAALKLLKLLRSEAPMLLSVATTDGVTWDYGASGTRQFKAMTTVELAPNSDCAALAARVVADLNEQLEGKAT